jgi:hypothetical protein
MGCDIHAYVDVPGYPEGITIHLGAINRRYRLFTWLANVRNDDQEVKPICNPKGLPEDVAWYILLRSIGWGKDGRSHSWHMVQDLLADEEIKKYPDFRDRCKQVVKMLGPNARLVFWFDN